MVAVIEVLHTNRRRGLQGAGHSIEDELRTAIAVVCREARGEQISHCFGPAKLSTAPLEARASLLWEGAD